MILTILFNFVEFLFDLISILLPSWRLPIEFINAFEYVVLAVLSWDAILPMSEMLIVMSVIITFEVSILFTRMIFGFLSIIRGGGKIDVK